MKILAYQGSSEFCDKAANIATISTTCKAAQNLEVDVAVFPELFTTGYNVGEKAHQLAEQIDGDTIKHLKQISHETGVCIVTGFIEKSEDEVFNSAIVISDDGKIVAHHRKVFLFGDTEKELFSAGDKFDTFELKGLRCSLSICYDVEFPEVTRSMARKKTQVLFNPTANMEPYREVPTTLVRARALENGIAIVYANLCGKENGLEYTGLSAIIGPNGLDLARAGNGSCTLIADIKAAVEANASTPASTQLQDLVSWK